MVRILHLLDRDADFETARGSEGLARALGDGFSVQRRTIGEGGDWRSAPIASAMLRRGGMEFDLIHAWGGTALAVAALGSRTPIIFSPSAETNLRTVRWLRAILPYRRIDVICPTTTLHRKLVERGIPIAQCHLVRPGVEFSRVKRRRDDALRARLGMKEDDFVLLAPGDSTRPAKHTDAMWAAGILYSAYQKYKLLTWGRGPMAASVRRFAEKTTPAAACDAEFQLGVKVEFEDLLPAADAVLVSARGPVATLPIAICMAAALPIVATVTPMVAELLEDRHTALMCPPSKYPSQPRVLAQRILDLVEDPSIQWPISDMARTEAFEFFTFTRFVNQFRTLYRQAANGERVDVPQQAPGAGLRFHGRG